MKNILRSAVYRLTRMKVRWVLLLITFGMTCMTAAALGILYGNASFITEFRGYMNTVYAEMGLTNPFTEFREIYDLNVENIFGFSTLSLTRELAFISTIFTVRFSVSLRNSGFVINLYPSSDRSYFFWSDALILFVYNLLLVLVTAGTGLIVFFVFFTGLPWGDAGMYLLHLILYALLLTTLQLLVCSFCRRSRGRTGGVLSSLLYVGLLSTVLYSGIDSLIQSVFNTDFYIEYILPLGNLELISYGKTDTYLAAAFVIVLFISFDIILELLVNKNKDVF